QVVKQAESKHDSDSKNGVASEEELVPNDPKQVGNGDGKGIEARRETSQEEIPNSGHILVADDDAPTRELLRTVLEEEGYEISEAGSGQEAFEAIKAGAYDLVLLDMRMPGMTGMEVLKQLREKQGEVPVILMTAHGSPNTAIQASSLGAYGY